MLASFSGLSDASHRRCQANGASSGVIRRSCLASLQMLVVKGKGKMLFHVKTACLLTVICEERTTWTWQQANILFLILCYVKKKKKNGESVNIWQPNCYLISFSGFASRSLIEVTQHLFERLFKKRKKTTKKPPNILFHLLCLSCSTLKISVYIVKVYRLLFCLLI